MTRVGGGGAGGRVRNACARRGQTSKCASSKLNRRVRAKGRNSAPTQNSRSAMAKESVEGAEERVERIVERVLERQLPIIVARLAGRPCRDLGRRNQRPGQEGVSWTLVTVSPLGIDELQPSTHFMAMRVRTTWQSGRVGKRVGKPEG